MIEKKSLKISPLMMVVMTTMMMMIGDDEGYDNNDAR